MDALTVVLCIVGLQAETVRMYSGKGKIDVHSLPVELDIMFPMHLSELPTMSKCNICSASQLWCRRDETYKALYMPMHTCIC